MHIKMNGVESFALEKALLYLLNNLLTLEKIHDWHEGLLELGTSTHLIKLLKIWKCRLFVGDYPKCLEDDDGKSIFKSWPG